MQKIKFYITYVSKSKFEYNCQFLDSKLVCLNLNVMFVSEVRIGKQQGTSTYVKLISLSVTVCFIKAPAYCSKTIKYR